MSKLKSLSELEKIIKNEKKEKKRVVWTNGCFDILHVGHIKCLKEAKKLGDILVVGINNDESTRKLKGKNRPIIPEKERAEILSALEVVDYVIIFSETSVENYLSKLKPDIFVKGADYLKNINEKERKTVEKYGGKIVYVPYSGHSTTEIIKKIKNM